MEKCHYGKKPTTQTLSEKSACWRASRMVFTLLWRINMRKIRALYAVAGILSSWDHRGVVEELHDFSRRIGGPA